MKPIYSGGMTLDLFYEDGQEDPRWAGWVFAKHPDGQLVSLAKIPAAAGAALPEGLREEPEEFADFVAELMREYGPDGHIDGHEMIAKSIWTWLKALATPPAVPAPAQGPTPDPKYCKYSHESDRGIVCAVSDDGETYVRPDATNEELRIALVSILQDEGIPLPEFAQEGSKPSAAPLRDFCPDCGSGGKVGSGEFETDCRRCDGTGLVEPEGFIPGEPTPSPGERGEGK